jgi:hypothetical protein
MCKYFKRVKGTVSLNRYGSCWHGWIDLGLDKGWNWFLNCYWTPPGPLKYCKHISTGKCETICLLSNLSSVYLVFISWFLFVSRGWNIFPGTGHRLPLAGRFCKLHINNRRKLLTLLFSTFGKPIIFYHWLMIIYLYLKLMYKISHWQYQANLV